MSALIVLSILSAAGRCSLPSLCEVFSVCAVSQPVDGLPVLGIEHQVGRGRLKERGYLRVGNLVPVREGIGDRSPDAVSDGQAASAAEREGPQERAISRLLRFEAGHRHGEKPAMIAHEEFVQGWGLCTAEQCWPSEHFIHGKPGEQELVATGTDCLAYRTYGAPASLQVVGAHSGSKPFSHIPGESSRVTPDIDDLALVAPARAQGL